MIRIDVLPDDVLLDIFEFYMEMAPFYPVEMTVEAWKPLVHVCRQWRNVVFGSPRRLNLRLCCTPNTPARDMLDVWPTLPLLIWGDMRRSFSSSADNIILALGQTNRVCHVDLWVLEDQESDKVLAAMQVPFPELAELRLTSKGETPLVIPDSFLGGSAPHLRICRLEGIPFPGLPKLLLSATHLVTLYLSDIPHSGYFSPEAMAALLSVLSSLESLRLLFRSSQSRPDRVNRRPSPSKRSVLPSLKWFSFEGVIEYLEDLVTDIDAPQLNSLYITFFRQINLDHPQLAQFISRSPSLRDRGADVSYFHSFDDHAAIDTLPPS